MLISVFAVTDRGIEKAVNDDRVLMGDCVLSAGCVGGVRELPFCAAVFDGVSCGGHGAEASSIASSRFVGYAERFGKGLFGSLSDEEALGGVLGDIQAELLAYRNSISSREAIATTVSGIAMGSDDRLLGFNVGDSRIYRFRAGMLAQMTTDDSMVQSLIDNGADIHLIEQAKEESAHVITKALGIPLKDLGAPVEDFGVFMLGDIYLGCTDGLSGFVSRDEIKTCLASDLTVREKGLALRDMALRAGSYDNISLFLIAIESSQQSVDGGTGGREEA